MKEPEDPIAIERTVTLVKPTEGCVNIPVMIFMWVDGKPTHIEGTLHSRVGCDHKDNGPIVFVDTTTPIWMSGGGTAIRGPLESRFT